MSILYGFLIINALLGPIQFSDLVILLLVTNSIIKYKTIMWNKKDVFLILFYICAFIPFIAYQSESYFDINGFVLSYIKLGFYVIAYITLPMYFSRDVEKFNLILKNTINLIFAYGMFQFFLFYLFPSIASIFIKYSSTTYGFFRITSIYNEPAGLFYPLMLYFYLIISKVNLKRYTHILCFLTTIMSFSITVYGVYLVGMFIINYSKSMNKKILITAFVALFASIAYFNIPLIQIHINNLLNLRNSSATTRVFGSFEYALKSPLLGVGLGNIENYYLENIGLLNLNYFSTQGAVNNIFSAIRLVSGLVGLVFFLVFVLSKYYKLAKQYLLIYLFSFLAWGHLNTSSFFFLLILMEILRLKASLNNKNKVEKYISRGDINENKLCV